MQVECQGAPRRSPVLLSERYETAGRNLRQESDETALMLAIQPQLRPLQSAASQAITPLIRKPVLLGEFCQPAESEFLEASPKPLWAFRLPASANLPEGPPAEMLRGDRKALALLGGSLFCAGFALVNLVAPEFVSVSTGPAVLVTGLSAVGATGLLAGLRRVSLRQEWRERGRLISGLKNAEYAVGYAAYSLNATAFAAQIDPHNLAERLGLPATHYDGDDLERALELDGLSPNQKAYVLMRAALTARNASGEEAQQRSLAKLEVILETAWHVDPLFFYREESLVEPLLAHYRQIRESNEPGIPTYARRFYAKVGAWLHPAKNALSL